MNKSELDHVWHSVTSALEKEFWTRGWLSPQADRIEALEAALRGAEHDWVAGEIKLLERVKEMLDAPHNYRRKHIMDEIDLAISALAPEPDK